MDDLRILPRLSIAKITEVNDMLSFSARSVHASIDFENLVSVRSLNECFGYQIPENKVTLDKRGAPILGWSVTTSRPIPGKAPKQAAQRGSTSRKQAEPPSRRTQASKVHKQATPAIQSSETSPDRLATDSSVNSDDTIMREIDEVTEASTEGDEGSSSPTVTILPSDPRAGTSSSAPGPRSPPPSFEDFIEETVIATLATSPAQPDPLPQPAESSAA